MLDVTFAKNASRVRKGHGAHNFAILRKTALNLLRQGTSAKVGAANKCLPAACDDHDRLLVLQTLFNQTQSPWKGNELLLKVFARYAILTAPQGG